VGTVLVPFRGRRPGAYIPSSRGVSSGGGRAVNGKNLLITAAVALAVVLGVRVYEQRKAG